MNSIIRAVFASLGSKAAIKDRYCQSLLQLIQISGYSNFSFGKYCIEQGYYNIAFWGYNEVTMAAVIELLKLDADCFRITIYMKKLPEDCSLLSLNINLVELNNRNKIYDKHDCIMISDYQEYLRIEIRNKFNKTKIDYSIISLHNRIANAYLYREISEINTMVNAYNTKIKRGGGNGIVIHLAIPDNSAMQGINRTSYTPIVRKSSKRKQKLLFGYYGKKKREECLKEFFRLPSYVKKGNLLIAGDVSGIYFNRKNGERNNVYDINSPKYTIWLVGVCIVSGSYVEDKYTLGSLLQKKLIDYGEMRYRVRAFGVSLTSYHRILEVLPVQQDDIVILIDSHQNVCPTRGDKALIREMRKLLRNENFFLDQPIHCNYRGNEVIVNVLFSEYLKPYIDKGEIPKNELIMHRENHCNKKDRVISGNIELDSYLRDLEKYFVEGKAGSIVMNCNPLTIGHQYIIERAAVEVDVLYIFVVEEDQSVFSYSDRLQLVKQGTAHLPNVIVIPSGRFILSADTFSEYFHKESHQMEKIDASKDVLLFGQYIAPTLNITIRFVGEEPFDRITKQYNESMLTFLPQFGVQVKVMKRLEKNNEVISASKVRECLKEQNWAKIKELVPKCTYQFLIQNNESIKHKLHV